MMTTMVMMMTMIRLKGWVVLGNRDGGESGKRDSCTANPPASLLDIVGKIYCIDIEMMVCTFDPCKT